MDVPREVLDALREAARIEEAIEQWLEGVLETVPDDVRAEVRGVREVIEREIELSERDDGEIELVTERRAAAAHLQAALERWQRAEPEQCTPELQRLIFAALDLTPGAGGSTSR